MVLNWLPPNDEIQDAQFLTESNLIESTYRSRKNETDHDKPNEIDHEKPKLQTYPYSMGHTTNKL